MPIVSLKEGLIVSDLHIGDGGRGDDFKPRAPLFLKLCEFCLRTHTSLVLAGDIVELHGYYWKDIIRKHSPVFCQLLRLRKSGLLYWVVGNHDGELGVLHSLFPGVVMEYLVVDTGSRAIWVEHGHRWDPLNRKPGWWQRTLCKVGTKLERWMPNIDVIHHKGLDKRLRNGAKSILEKQEFDTVVMGHTHHKGEEKIKTEWGMRDYFNCGTWTRSGVVAVHFCKESVRLLPIVETGEEIIRGK